MTRAPTDWRPEMAQHTPDIWHVVRQIPGLLWRRREVLQGSAAPREFYGPEAAEIECARLNGATAA